MFTISFDFDETTKKIKNLKVISSDPGAPTLQLLDNKIQLSQAAMELIGAKVGDRLVINYWTVDNQLTFPVISLATDKTEEGTKTTKSLTMSYRGKQAEILKMYGENFRVEPFKDNMFKLVKIEEENLSEEMIDLENTNNLTFNDFNEE
jgi:hypothetical protein